MYSAESTLQDINALDDTQHKIDCIKEYAQSVAKQALKDATENAKVMVTNPDTNQSHISSMYDDPDGDTIRVCKESILNTEIQTP